MVPVLASEAPLTAAEVLLRTTAAVPQLLPTEGGAPEALSLEPRGWTAPHLAVAAGIGLRGVVGGVGGSIRADVSAGVLIETGDQDIDPLMFGALELAAARTAGESVYPDGSAAVAWRARLPRDERVPAA